MLVQNNDGTTLSIKKTAKDYIVSGMAVFNKPRRGEY
jgi:hypothetical protein